MGRGKIKTTGINLISCKLIIMNIKLLKKLRGKYRLVQTTANDFIWEKRTCLKLWKWQYCFWDEATIGSHEYGFYHKTRSEAIRLFIAFIHIKYRESGYKRKKIYVL